MTPAIIHQPKAPPRAPPCVRHLLLTPSPRVAHASIFPPTVQAKLRVGEPQDRFEQEAEQAANQIMRMPEPQPAQRSGLNSIPAAHSDAPPLVRDALRSPGQPLDPAARDFMEPRLGRDLGNVRVHTGAAAARSARGLGACAYTLGRDVVFGEGGYAPRTPEGRKLLAHELTHVVQQGSGRAAPAIQRRLLVTGSPGDIRELLGLLEPAAGLSLKYDLNSKSVSITGGVLKPRSSVLALLLWTIIDDQQRDARINLGRTQPGVSFGAFPSDLDPKKAVQELRIDHFLALEKGAPGNGIAKLAHEIAENYEGQAHRTESISDAFSASHQAAVKIEDLVSHELVGPGHRRSSFSITMGKGPSQFFRDIADVENYFVVSDRSVNGATLSNVRRVPRVRVAHFRLTGFDATTTSTPKVVDPALNDLVAAMKKEPTASALVESRASVQDAGHTKLFFAGRWARLVQDEIINRTNDVELTNWRRFHMELAESSSDNSVSVTLERPNI